MNWNNCKSVHLASTTIENYFHFRIVACGGDFAAGYKSDANIQIVYGGDSTRMLDRSYIALTQPVVCLQLQRLL